MIIPKYQNGIGVVLVIVLPSHAGDQGSNPGWVKPKTLKLVFAASPLSTQHEGVRAKTDRLGVSIMCPSGVTCLPKDCYFSVVAL